MNYLRKLQSKLIKRSSSGKDKEKDKEYVNKIELIINKKETKNERFLFYLLFKKHKSHNLQELQR